MVLSAGAAAPWRIPFNRPTRTSNDLSYVEQALAVGHWSGDGPFTHRCHRILEAALQAPKVLLTTSCTHALEMSALLVNIEPGDEVIVPSYTFVSSVNAFVLRGARAVFADIRPDTLGIDERHVERLITPRTRAIVVVHYAGCACEMDAIETLAQDAGAALIEDNAHGLFASYKRKPLGRFGLLSTLSFHETKNLTCGEGGALVINDERLVERAELIREKGTDRSRFFRGEVDKYGWVDLGSSYLPSEILAALLCAQLEDRQQIQHQRRRIWGRYRDALADWSRVHDMTLPCDLPNRTQSFHMFYMLAPSRAVRDALLAHLKSRGILAVSHYLPLHVSKMGRLHGGQPGDCPVAERVADVVIRLPFYTNMTEAEQDQVLAALDDFRSP